MPWPIRGSTPAGRPGNGPPGRKVLTLVHAMVAGADCIDDCDVLRSGATGKVLGHGVMAPSTLGTFLRSFTFGHVRQLDRLSEALLTRAWAFGAGPGDDPMTIDIDSTIQQVYGKQKEGAAYGYTKVLGEHPLVATRSDTGEVLHIRHRKGSANAGRGGPRFVRELIGRARRAGATGPLTLRADSGFHSSTWVAPVVTTTGATRSPSTRTRLSPGQSRPSPNRSGSESTTRWAAGPRWPSAPTATGTVSSSVAPALSASRPSCSPRGATTPSSPIGKEPRSSSMPTTDTTPWSNWPSAI